MIFSVDCQGNNQIYSKKTFHHTHTPLQYTPNISSLNTSNLSNCPEKSCESANFTSQATENGSSPSLRSGESLNINTAGVGSAEANPEFLGTQCIKNHEKKDKSMIGIVNLGNTCFLNSCIQVLNYTSELAEILKQNDLKKDEDGTVSSEWLELYDMMWSSEVLNKTGISINPSKFVNVIQCVAQKKDRDIFTGWSQNDMSEFLLFIMDCFHGSISKSVIINISGNPQNVTDKIAVKCYSMIKTVYEKEYSEILRDFYGIYVSKITSISSEENERDIHDEINVKPELFFLLDLPIPELSDVNDTHHSSHVNDFAEMQCRNMRDSPEHHFSVICGGKMNIYNCLDLMTTPELLSGDNAWYNDLTGKKEDALKELKFWSLPKILIITLKRFSFMNDNKNETFVYFPINNLDLSKYIIGYDASSYIYDLYGVCNHYGNGLNGGHYTSIIKVDEDEWLHFNDTQIHKISKTDVMTPNAYCLFYRKR
jgi:ubiquitin C-terminal hydrolase